jgi:hypothetical protein
LLVAVLVVLAVLVMAVLVMAVLVVLVVAVSVVVAVVVAVSVVVAVVVVEPTPTNPIESLLADSPLATLLVGKTSLSLIPIKFSDFLVNTSKDVSGKTIETSLFY